MASGRGFGRKGGEGDDEDRLPWLEPADIDYDDEPLLARKWILLGAVVFLGALVLTVGLIYSRAGGDGGEVVATGDGEPPLIAAPAEPFRQRPDDPGGLEVDSKGLLLDHMAQGDEPTGEPKLATAPEQPVARPLPAPTPSAETRPAPATPAEIRPAPATPAPAAATPAAATPAKPVETKPAAAPPVAAKSPAARSLEAKPPVVSPEAKAAPKPATKPEAKPETRSGNPVYYVQLGAFSSKDRAQAGWIQFAQKFDELKGLSADIQPVSAGAKTMYRLRGGAISYRPKAESICTRLKAAGQPCIIVDK